MGTVALSGHGTLKFGVSEEVIDLRNLFFCCSYRSRKDKIFFNNFWVGVIKSGHGY